MKGFIWGALIVIIIFWRLGVVGVSCTPLSVHNDSARPPLEAAHPGLLKGEGFSVRMPGSPVRTAQSVSTSGGPSVRGVAYESQHGGYVFGVQGTEIPPGAHADLHLVIADGAAGFGGSVRDERRTTYHGLEAREVRIVGARDGTIFVRAILTPRSYYVLYLYVDRTNLPTPPAAYADFVGSMKIG